jgi:hypothetical protein
MSDADKAAPVASADKLAPVSPVEKPSIASVIDTWFHDHFHGTALGNHTELWNLAVKAKEELKTLLADF